MTISGDAVTGVSASATAGGADEMFFSQANAKVPGAILANGGVSGVDGVSGATKSSNAIKAAYTSAYQSDKKLKIFLNKYQAPTKAGNVQVDRPCFSKAVSLTKN